MTDLRKKTLPCLELTVFISLQRWTNKASCFISTRGLFCSLTNGSLSAAKIHRMRLERLSKRNVCASKKV